jgi:hypothetical protein
MKSEERHKLQRNVLAHWLADAYRKVAPYSQSILFGGAALLTVLVVVTWWRNHAATTSASASDSLFAALGDTEKLDELAAESPNRGVGVWAALAAADKRLERGSRALFTNRATASKELQEAVEGYSQVLDGNPAPIVRLQARFGRARAYEALMGTRQGGEYYKDVLADYKAIEDEGGLFSAQAKERIAALESQAVIEFYRKFAEYNPPPRPSESGAFGKLPLGAGAAPDQNDDFSKTFLNLNDLRKKEDEKDASRQGQGKGSSDKPAADKSQTTPPAKDAAKQPAKEPAKESAKEPVKEAAKAPAGAAAPVKTEVPKK